MVRSIIGAGIVLGCTLSAGILAGTRPDAQQVPKVDFARDIRPILQQRCYECHGPEQQKNGFRLDRRTDAMRGGTIAVIGPGNSEGSRLYHRLIGAEFGRQMPPDGALPPAQIATIKAWIDQGAEWPDEVSGDVPPPPPDPRATELMKALRAGDNARVTRLLQRNAGAVNRRGPGGATPLMYAVLYSDTATVRRLLDRGADPNLADEGGATPLMWAVRDLDKTRLLVERGARVRVRSALGLSPLLIASGVRGGTPVVELLLDNGADPSEKVPGLLGETTPLMQAMLNGDESVFRLLVQRGANLAGAGPETLALAMRAQCTDCVEMMLKQLDAEALTGAMFIGSPPFGPSLATPMLMARGADPQARDPHGRTMLMLAAGSDALPVEAVRLLIERGVDVNARTASGDTALRLARLRGDTPVTKLLLAAGAKDEPLPPPPSGYAPTASPGAAVARSLPLLQKTDESFMRMSGCVSCHHNTLTAQTVSLARSRGIRPDERIARAQLTAISRYLESWRARVLQGVGIPGNSDTISYILLGLAAERHPPDAATDAMARFLKGEQREDGHWRLLAHRPPIESSEVQVTAMSMRALQLYAPRTQRDVYREAIDRAAAWIGRVEPAITEDHVFKLFGLHWAKAGQEAIREAAAGLIAAQRSDGGWAQIPTLASDAYATGQALVALAESGAATVNSETYQRGVQFLLKTQLDDGSWFVRTRAIPLQPHFESGFPHGRDQFISAAGTNWATMALTYAEQLPASSSRLPAASR